MGGSGGSEEELSACTLVDFGLGLGDPAHNGVQHAKVLRK